MQIIAALFIDDIEMRQVPGPATRIDLRGIQFSAPAPKPFPVTVEPHLMVIVRCPPDGIGSGVLETVFTDEHGTEVARNVQPLAVEPGRFRQQLVRADLTYSEPGTIEANCRIDQGPPVVVPYTILPPVDTTNT
ncbi:MAG: hypothetical protein ACKO5A_06210 [Actinomycetota bacterium]